MNPDPLDSLDQLETELWQAADNLRANSGLVSSEYCMPVLGVIFLRHAANRFEAATRQIQEDQAAGRMPRRAAVKADYIKRRALLLPEKARYDYLLARPKDADLGQALVEAMNAIEAEFPPLQDNLPKEYSIFERGVLEDLLRVFNSEALRAAGGDVFGRIYEYFLMKFAMQGAQDNGEFFTPPSLVQTIVNVIEPDHGVILDPACGSGGMFVQTSHFIERRGQDTARRVTFYGQEKTRTTIRLARMNLAVHGLEGDIRARTAYFHKQVVWLQDRFPEAKLRDVPGLVKLVDRADIEAADWSLTPGRYVGVAPQEEDEDFDFEAALRDIHTELAGLNGIHPSNLNS